MEDETEMQRSLRVLADEKQALIEDLANQVCHHLGMSLFWISPFLLLRSSLLSYS